LREGGHEGRPYSAFRFSPRVHTCLVALLGIVLLVVNLFGELVLLLINGLAVSIGQLPAISLAHAFDFTVHTLFFILQI